MFIVIVAVRVAMDASELAAGNFGTFELCWNTTLVTFISDATPISNVASPANGNFAVPLCTAAPIATVGESFALYAIESDDNIGAMTKKASINHIQRIDSRPSINPTARGHDGFDRMSPEEVGIDAGGIERFIDAIEKEGFEMHSVMLAIEGKVVAQGWWAPYGAHRLHMQHSLTKSFMAAGVGIAVAEGLLKPEDRVTSFFEDQLDGPIDAHLSEMTVGHLLTMSVGHARGISGSVWRPIRTSWVQEFFKEPIVNPPGSTFLYSSAASYMLSAIVQKASGVRLDEYMRPRFFELLGINGFEWDICPHGIASGGNGFSCSTSTLLKLGELHRQKGRWNGVQVLPESWVEAATTTRILAEPETGTGYGYQWWTLPDGTYFGWGIFGQYVIVMPQFGAVLAVTGGMAQMKDPFIACVQRCLYPVIARRTARGSAGSQELLESRLSGLTLKELAAPSDSGIAASISGKRFEMEGNEDGVISITLNFDQDTCRLLLEDSRGSHSIVAGMGRGVEGATSMTGNRLHHEYQMDHMKVFAHGEWVTSQTLVLTWQFVESAFRDTVRCTFQNEKLIFDRSTNVNTGPLHGPTIRGRASHSRN